MTAGNGVNHPTPFLSSTDTGGNPSVYGLDEGTPGDIALGTIGADMGSPAGSVSMGEAGYGYSAMQNAESMQNMNGPGSEETTFATCNADATGQNAMQDMSGANLGAPTKAMNRDSGENLPGQGNDRNWNPMSSYQ